MSQPYSHVAGVIQTLVTTGARRATKYLSPKHTVKVTRQRKPDRRYRQETFLVTIGGPNYLERLFIKDKAAVAPLNARSRNFVAIPKRRGGRIWTKRPNKIHLPLNKGDGATIKVTPQAVKDLASVEEFVQVAAQ